MEIGEEKGSFKEFFKETDSVGITFLFPPCFKNKSILSINDRVTIERQDDTLCLESKSR